MQWDLPSVLNPSRDTLHKLQREYACQLLVSPTQFLGDNGSTTVRAYGFDTLLDEVLSELLTASPPTTPLPESYVDEEGLCNQLSLSELPDSPRLTSATELDDDDEESKDNVVMHGHTETVTELLQAERDLLLQCSLGGSNDSTIDIPSKLGTPQSHVYSMQFSFADRESGIFYQAFETDFNLCFSRAFGVSISRLESLTGSVSDDTGSNSTRGGGGERNKALRVTVSGLELRCVQMCISKLNRSLNTTTLRREMVYYPRCSMDFYQQLLNLKEVQDRRFLRVRKEERLKRRAFGDVLLDPMINKGFVSIRIKPPMHNKGISFMKLPADSTVTVCGPHVSQEQREQFERALREWEELPSPYPCGTMELKSNNPYCKEVTVKSSREGYCRKMGLVGLKVNESVAKKTGVAGHVKMWAKDHTSLAKALRKLEEAQIHQDLPGISAAGCSTSTVDESNDGMPAPVYAIETGKANWKGFYRPFACQMERLTLTQRLLQLLHTRCVRQSVMAT